MAKRNPQDEMQQQAQNMQMLQQIGQMEKVDRLRKQEEVNTNHDTEFTQFSEGNGMNTMGTLGVIGDSEVASAYQVLLKYREEKQMLERKIGQNEEFWKMNHWEVAYSQEANANKRVKPKSAWLLNTIINKHADAMDNYPEANILPRAQDDEQVADILKTIIPVILEQNDYEQTYSDCQWYKCKNGTSVQGVFWDNDKNNGLGDIEIKKIDLLNLFWKGGITDIQDSPNVFHVTMMDNDEVKARYPEINVGSTDTLGLTVVETYHQGVDTSNMTAVVDWYYKKRVSIRDEIGIPKMQTVLHYCKFCNGQVIYASENDPNYADRGWYDHGLYPFVFDVLFPIESNVCGMGYIDVVKDDQIYIDKLQQAILESAVVNARPRYFYRNDGSINEDEFLDLSKMLIHVDGNLGDDSLKPVENSNFNAIYETVYLNKVNEMKETSGNTAASQGQTSSVTSASGIASLQEAAGKLARDANTTSYRAFKQTVNLVIELMRQFYNEPRCFRVVGDFGRNEYVEFDNALLKPQSQGQAFGIDLGSRLPIMDIDVKPQKKNAYTKESQNQTAMNLYNMGFFNADNSDAALACLDMMDFDQIDAVKEKINQNGTLLDMVQQLQAQLAQAQAQMIKMGMVIDSQNGTNMSEEISQAAMQSQDDLSGQIQKATNGGSKNGSGTVTESKGSLSSQAASATRGSTAPR